MANLFSKKLKPVHELVADPDFSFRVGQLVGAAEMAGLVLTKVDNPDYKHVGEQLAHVADWFFEKEKVRSGL